MMTKRITAFWSNFLSSSREIPPSLLLHKNQIASESVHGSKLAIQHINCQGCCLEEQNCSSNKKCQSELNSADQEVNIIINKEINRGGNSSFAHAVINMVGMLIGLGQLSSPYALENGGWVSVFLLIALGIACAYSSHLLGKCLEKSPKSRSYADIGQEAYGARGRAIAATFIYLEIFMALVSYTISLHDNLSTVFLNIIPQSIRVVPWWKLSSAQLLTSVAVMVALPSLWLRDLSSISFLSIGGILMSAVIFVSVALTAIFGGVRADHAIPALRIRKIPAISGLYIFSYAGHIVFPDLHASMKDPSKFTKVSIVSFTLVTSLYTSMGFMGAKMFGPNISSQITLSLPPHQVFTKIALWATVLTPMTKYALEFAPFAIHLERKLPSSMSSQKKMLIRGTVGSVLLLVILVLALSVPYFEYVLSLTGSLVSICICVILPSCFYIKISWPQISKPCLALNITLIALGSILGAFGTIASSKLLYQNLQRRHSPTTRR